MAYQKAQAGQASPWKGRILILVGLLAVAFTLRTGVTALPPITAVIDRDVPMPSVLVGVVGMLPTALFALGGLLTPLVMRRVSLEALTVGAMLVAAAGALVRALAPDTALFLAGTAVALAGMGAGNVVLPPLVRKYFASKMGVLTALYVLTINVGTTVPPLLAVPVADAAGWRMSLGWWAALNIVAILPWLSVWPRRRGRSAEGGSPSGTADDGGTRPRVVVRPWRAPAGWGLALLFGCTSLNTYAMFAWLPTILRDAGLSASEAGLQLSLFAALGLPLSLGVPILAGRLRNPFPLVVFGGLSFAAGYAGLLLAPGTATWLWSSLAGLGPATFPLALVLINLRTRSHQTTGAVSGFAQGVGYLLACTGPLLTGALHDATGTWTASFAFLGATLVAQAIGGWMISRPHFIDDHPRVIEEVGPPRAGPK